MNTNINPVTINLGTKHILSSFSTEREEHHHPLNIPWKTNKYLIWIIIVLLIGLGIVLTILFVNFNRMICKRDGGNLPTEQRKHDQNVQSLQNSLVAKDQSIHQLQQQIDQFQQERSKYKTKSYSSFFDH